MFERRLSAAIALGGGDRRALLELRHASLGQYGQLPNLQADQSADLKGELRWHGTLSTQPLAGGHSAVARSGAGLPHRKAVICQLHLQDGSDAVDEQFAPLAQCFRGKIRGWSPLQVAGHKHRARTLHSRLCHSEQVSDFHAKDAASHIGEVQGRSAPAAEPITHARLLELGAGRKGGTADLSVGQLAGEFTRQSLGEPRPTPLNSHERRLSVCLQTRRFPVSTAFVYPRGSWEVYMNTDVTYELASNVKHALDVRGWSVQRLADEMNEPFEVVRRRTVGKKLEFTLSQLAEIAELLDWDPYEFLPELFRHPKT